MKVKGTVGAIGFFTYVGAATVGLAVAGVIQVAAAGIELLVVAPFAQTRKMARARKLTVVTPRTERVDVRRPQAA